jgi:hypothetical protein
VNDIKAKLKQAWDENPLALIAVLAVAVTAASKLIDSVSSANNSRAWQKEVNRRDRNSRK